MSEPTAGVIVFIDRTWDDQPVGPEERVTLFLIPTPDGGIIAKFIAPFHRDPPPDAPPGPTDRLWEHEVVELFVAGAGQPVPYTEVEIGPYGHTLVLRLRGVRQVEETLIPLRATMNRDSRAWEAEFTLSPALLPPAPHRFLACSVHGPAQDRRYLCWPPLPGPKPDFHQPDRWTPLIFPS